MKYFLANFGQTLQRNADSCGEHKTQWYSLFLKRLACIGGNGARSDKTFPSRWSERHWLLVRPPFAIPPPPPAFSVAPINEELPIRWNKCSSYYRYISCKIVSFFGFDDDKREGISETQNLDKSDCTLNVQHLFHSFVQTFLCLKGQNLLLYCNKFDGKWFMSTLIQKKELGSNYRVASS